MLAIKVPKREAERVRRRLLELGVLAKGYSIKREGDFVLFPVTERVEGFELVESEFKESRKRPHSYREVVEVPAELRPLLPSSFDIIGDIAIIELPEELVPHGRAIGEAILKVHRHIKAVFAKGSAVSGEYRVREL
ncbi:class I SAM-dependent methyltransferase family protein, partial [Thermococcus sp.]